jgi:hypothetical protein
MILKNALIICFSALIISLFGCSTVDSSNSNLAVTWPIAKYPQMKQVTIIHIKTNNMDGMFMDMISATNLVDNVDSLKAYNKKLEIFIKKMSEYYKFKTEEI